jgi:hypothetical protein
MANSISKQTSDFLISELNNIKRSVEFNLENSESYLDKLKENLDKMTEEYSKRAIERNDNLDYIRKIDNMISELQQN